jgi:hypothetical protein
MKRNVSAVSPSTLKLIISYPQLELAARYVPFKVDALQRVAANAVGAKQCVSMVKSNEGT